MLTTVILLLTGVESPFFYFTLATALLGGLLYGWGGGAIFSVMLVGVYYWALQLDAGTVPDTFQTYFGQPALYPLVAATGAAARRLLDRQAEAEAELAEQQGRLAAEGERARLARDMHDSLAKTVSGIGFAALALSRRIERDPEGAVVEARRLAEDARQATRQAREIIVGLRAETGESLPLSSALASTAQGWARETGVQLDLAIEEVGELHPQSARELEWILSEALANVHRHARAGRVTVRLRRLGGRARADGVGRRRRLRRARRPRRAAGRPPLRRRRHARARADGRRRLQRRGRAGRGLRAVGVGADGDRTAVGVRAGGRDRGGRARVG